MPVTTRSGKELPEESSASAASTVYEAPSMTSEAQLQSTMNTNPEPMPATAETETRTIQKNVAVSSKRMSSKSRRSLKLTQAKEDLLKLQIQLATIRIAKLEDEDYDDDTETNISESQHSERVTSWVKEAQSQLHLPADKPPCPPVPPSPATPPAVIRHHLKQSESTHLPPPQKSDIATLACAITEAICSSRPPPTPRYVTDLPSFSGAHLDWLSFKTAYYESAALYSDIENTARLRRHIRGRAREAVENLLINHTRPEDIMKSLETRFGRPDSIAATELERLRSLPKPADTPKDICIFASRVSNTVAALTALNKLYYLYNPEITKITIEKLPSTLRYRWFDFAATQPEDQPDLLKISKFLEREAELCGPYAQPEIVSTPPQDYRSRQHQRTLTTTTVKPIKCQVCDEDGHKLSHCRKFIDLDVNTRWDLAKERRLCFRCLRYRNKTHSCRRIKCDINDCPYFHNKLLHFTKQKQDNIEFNTEKEAVTSTWTEKKSQSYLKILPVRVAGPHGEIDTWALLDDGSTVTLVDDELATNIGATGPIDPLHIEAIADTKLAETKSRRVSLMLYGATEHYKINARTIDRLQLSPQRITDQDIDRCLHLQDIQNHIKYDEAIPKILIGQDNWDLLLAYEVRKGRRDQPVASRTALGWVLHGAHTRTLGQRVNFVHHMKTEAENSMDEQLKQFFAIENLMIQPKKPHRDPEQRALKILQENIIQLEDGHYESALLWKSDDVTMPENYNNALQRLTSIEKKLAKDATLKEKYLEQMQALLLKGYAELAPPSNLLEKRWYLPHFAVVNPMKPEKIRIVHDAAAKTGGTSLNDQLLTGPDLLQSLPGVLMRFRRHRIAVSADITEMFMQVKIKEQDRDYLRYLWRDNDTKQPPREYRMTSLIFGATCSPSTAIFVKNFNAKKYEKSHPDAAAAIIENHYVDDYLDSHETVKETVEIAKQVRNIHRGGHFELRKWISNSPEVLHELCETEEKVTSKCLTDNTDSERVLGLVWKPGTDELSFNLNLARIPEEKLQSDTPTKRDALRIVMSLYDPLGLASPVINRAKQILQEVWRRGTSWDQQLDADVTLQWKTWLTHLHRLRYVAVPRCYLNYSTAVSLQLHIFVDASEAAYAAALYWRAVTPDGQASISLITAKSRVAPLKPTSIPRLELQAAVMGCRMAAAVIDEHDRKPEKKVFWTDSKTVLTWLKTGSRSYKPFVAHRVAAIEENSSVHEWRWIPTKMNVADDATRDVPQDFDRNHRWFTGPNFLREDESTWPTERITTTEKTGEEKCNYKTNCTTTKLSHCTPDSRRFSKWEKLLRTTARVLQFIQLCRPNTQRSHYKRTRKNTEKDPEWKRQRIPSTPCATKKKLEKASKTYIKLNSTLLRQAEDLIIRKSQEETFFKEIEVLRMNRAVSSSSRLRSISLSYVNGIIRLSSRIRQVVDVPALEMAPPVLDGNDYAVKLFIDYIHRQLLHAGVETTINECRQQFWILRLRPVTRMIVHRCLPCRLRKDKPPQPSTGNHPACRLAHHQRPFTFTGIDYFGPMTVTTGRSTQKKYVALFTCLTTRAVHLELAASLSTDSAVMALRRMIARRGCPSEIWSDNGTNLRGADRELRLAIDEATEQEATKRMISWRFIPPGAPFMGGAWERLVRSVKTALAATQQSRHPTEEVLTTLLTEAEYTVNSRPLTHVSVNHEDDEAITPNHYLLGGSARVPTPGRFSERDLLSRSHWRASQHLADLFWARWVREYLPELQNRRAPLSRGDIPKVGDVVFIADNTLPRNTWPRGVITATYPGADNVIRVVDVRTRTGVLRRPTKKIVIIPTDPAVRPRDCECNDPSDARRGECSGRLITDP